MVKALDDAVGKIVETLAETNMMENRVELTTKKFNFVSQEKTLAIIYRIKTVFDILLCF